MRGLLVASYGTVVEGARRGIDQLVCELETALPDMFVVQAVAGRNIRRIMRARGMEAPAVAEGLACLREAGVNDVVVLPAVVAAGRTLDAIEAVARQEAPAFAHLRMAKPLLSSQEDVRVATRLLLADCPVIPSTAYVLVAHGAGRRTARVMRLLEGVARGLGRDDVQVAVLSTDSPDVVAGGLPIDASRVVLVPVLLQFGSHASHDLLGEEGDSWRSRLEAHGVVVQGVRRGLLDLPEMRTLLVGHARAAMAVDW